MMKKIKEKMLEPSTHAGLALVIGGIGQMFDINEAPTIAAAIETASPAISGGDWFGAAMIFFGGLAMFFKEKVKKQW